MLKSLKRITYFVEDIEKAKEWYNTILKTEPVFDTPFAKIYLIGNYSLSLAVLTSTQKEPNERMQVYWEVDDIESAFEKLVNLGAKVKTPIKEILNIRTAQLIDPFGNIIGLTGELLGEEKRTVDKHPSGTAQSVAFCRALASKENRTEVKGPDYLAELFVNDDARKILQKEESIKWASENLIKSSLYGYFIARTAFFDSIFRDACEDGIAQIVLLGAGYDTRAYRFKSELNSTNVFELDISPTQQRKIEILQKNQIDIPDSLTFVPINFKTDNIFDTLSKNGYYSSRKTLFIWEGVTYYLTKEEVEKTFSFIQEHSPEESIVCFDYLTDKLESINPAEPLQFWITKEEIKVLLSENHIEIDEHIDSAAMTNKYLTLEDGTIAESIIKSFCFVKAHVV